jgi:hypothetical protein
MNKVIQLGGSAAFIPTFENAAYGIEWTKDDNDIKKGVNHSDITIDNIQDKCYFIGDQPNTNNCITEFDFRFGPYFVPNKVGTNKKADYN